MLSWVVFDMSMSRDEFQHTVLPLRDKLFRFSFRFLMNREDASDVVQDVMMKFWEQGAKMAEINNVEAWCMTMVRNKSLDQLKRKGRQSSSIEEEFQHPSHYHHPEKQLEQKEALEKVKAQIALLPMNQRTVLELRELQGKSYQEIAEVLEMDISLVKVSLHRARKKLREMWIKENEYGL